MNRNKKISMAVLAGAAAVFVGTSAKAALQLEYTRTPTTFSNGSYDVIDVIVTGMTAGAGSGAVPVILSTSSSMNAGGAADNSVGPVTGDAGTSPADPEILALAGTFTESGVGNVIGTPGFSGTTGAHTYQKYIVNQADPQYSGSPAGYGSSFASLPSLQSASLTGDTGSSATGSAAISGNSTALTGTWFVTPAFTGAAGSVNNQGGIEPGADASGLGEPNGLVAEILITKNGGFTFTGSYGDYGNGGNAQSLAFSVPAVGAVSSGHAIISLTAASGGDVTGYTPTVGSTLVITGSAGHYTYASTTFTGVATGTVEAKTFNPTTDEEIYALDVKNGTGQATDAATIAGDINSGGTDTNGTVPASVGVVASTTAPAGTSFGSQYNLFLTFAAPATGSGDNLLGFDLSQDLVSAGGNVANGDVIAAVAVVPEPASAAFILVGASGMLLGRKRKALPVA